MQLWSATAGVLAFAATLLYLYAFVKFHGIVSSERPEWVDHKGALSFFYEGLPRAFEPNVGLAVLRTAFSRRIYELSTPGATTYAHLIRVLLPFGLTL